MPHKPYSKAEKAAMKRDPKSVVRKGEMSYGKKRSSKKRSSKKRGR